MGAFSQVVAGEALVTVDYRNNGPGVGHVGFTANQPFSTVVPVQLGAVPGGALNVKRGAYMAGTTDVHASAKRLPAKNMLACCCGGLPPVIQVVKGLPSGVAFLSAAGTVVSRQLQAGEAIQVDSTPSSASEVGAVRRQKNGRHVAVVAVARLLQHRAHGPRPPTSVHPALRPRRSSHDHPESSRRTAGRRPEAAEMARRNDEF